MKPNIPTRRSCFCCIKEKMTTICHLPDASIAILEGMKEDYANPTVWLQTVAHIKEAKLVLCLQCKKDAGALASSIFEYMTAYYIGLLRRTKKVPGTKEKQPEITYKMVPGLQRLRATLLPPAEEENNQ